MLWSLRWREFWPERRCKHSFVWGWRLNREFTSRTWSFSHLSYCSGSSYSWDRNQWPLSLRLLVPILKITSDEYTNFGILITNHMQQDNKYQSSIINGVGDQPCLCLEPSYKTKRIINIESWMSAFRIFVEVYTRKYPAQAPALMKYSNLI